MFSPIGGYHISKNSVTAWSKNSPLLLRSAGFQDAFVDVAKGVGVLWQR
jgi:hypothetical protein